jgi:hypothetical protein
MSLAVPLAVRRQTAPRPGVCGARERATTLTRPPTRKDTDGWTARRKDDRVPRDRGRGAGGASTEPGRPSRRPAGRRS